MQGPGAGDMPTNMQSGQSAPFAQPHWTPVKTKNDLRDLYGTVAKGEILSSSICSIYLLPKMRVQTKYSVAVGLWSLAARSNASSSLAVGDYVAQGIGQKVAEQTTGNASSSISANSSAASTTSTSSPLITPAPSATANGTLGWQTTGPNITFPGAITNNCWEVPCDIICEANNAACNSAGSSAASVCSPQWAAYSSAYSAYVDSHYTGNFTTTYGDIAVNTNYSYPTTSTATQAYTLIAEGYGQNIDTTVTPVYVFGDPETIVYTTTLDWYTATVPSSDPDRWESITVTGTTYGSTYTTAYLDLTELPRTALYPVPTPACSITDVLQETCGLCGIYGGTVQVFYWPDAETSVGSIETGVASATANVTNRIATVDGATITSPSVAISFDTVYASNSCGRVGSGHAGSILILPPQSVSTVYGLAYIPAGVPGGASVFNFNDLNGPVPVDAYERQVSCVENGGCPTIYPEYTPTIAIPNQVRSMDPAWASCYPDFRGIYDPPSALQPQATVVGPSVHWTTPASPSATPTTPWADSTSTPDAAQTTVSASYNAPIIESSQTSLVVPSAVAHTSETALMPMATPSGESTPTELPDQYSSASSEPQGSTDPAQQTSPPVDASTSQNAGGAIASLLAAAGSTDPTTAARIFDGTTYAPAQSSGIVLGSQTVPPGSQIIESGTTYSLDPSASNLVINGATHSAVTPAQTPTTILADGIIYTQAASSALVINGETLSPGSQATISGATYSLDPSAQNLIIDGATQGINRIAPTPTNALVFDGTTYTSAASGILIAGSRTLLPGSQLALSGTTYKLGASASYLVINGATQTPQVAGMATVTVDSSDTLTMPIGAVVTLGVGSYAETVRVETTDGVTEAILGTTRTEILGAAVSRNTTMTMSASASSRQTPVTTSEPPVTFTAAGAPAGSSASSSSAERSIVGADVALALLWLLGVGLLYNL